MVDKRVPASLFAEAEDENTSAARLKELVQIADLHLLLAANPATPANALKQLCTANDPAIRRAVALNPNTSLTDLCNLAAKFPEEFLHNPIIPILNMTQPDFIKKLPFMAWASLLRFADLSPAWFQQVKDDIAYQRNQAASWELIQLHVSLGKNGLLASTDVRRVYQKQLPKSVALAPEEDVELFLLFVMLCPDTAPMLKKQWITAAQTSPRRVGIALSLLREVGSRTPGRLAQEKHPFVLGQVARHPATPPRVLKQLAMHNRRKLAATNARTLVRRATASNPHTPLEALYQLASSEDAGLSRVAARHPSLEMIDREILALDREESVRAALATTPELTTYLYEQLVDDPAPTVRAALARNLKIPLALLSDLARDSEPLVRAAAAGNPRLPSKAQAMLLSDPVESVRASLSGNARLSTEHAALLAHDLSPGVRAYLAANPRTPATLITTLLQTAEPEVQAGLARHPKLQPELLAQLAHQGDQRTRVAVAAHPRTPAETLAELAQENTHTIWCALASNPHTPLSVLELAIHTSSLDIRHRLLHHPAMLHEKRRPLLKLLAAKIQPLIADNRLPDWLRRVFLQYYTALPLEIVALFAASPYWQERYLLARRPHLAEPILQTLAQDGICHVQSAARQALEQRRKR